MVEGEPSGEWIALPGTRIWDRLGPNTSLAFLAPLYVAWITWFLVRSLFDEDSVVLMIVTAVGTLVIAGAAMLLILRHVTRGPEVDAATPRMRRGRRIAGAGAVTSITVARLGRRRDILVLGMRGRGIPWLTFPFVVGEQRLDPRQLDAVVRFLAATRAELPRDRYDPHGHMSRIANPGYLTAEDAVLLVRHPEELERFLPTQPRSRPKAESPEDATPGT